MIHKIDLIHKLLSNVQVYIDSPMAITTTQVFRRNAQVFDDETKEYILAGDNPLDFPNLHFTRTSDESKALNEDKRPKIIISASGMCDAGRICHHLKHNLWDARNSIVFVGYQANGTLGRRIVDGEKEVPVLGERILVQAKIHSLEGFSGHADRDGLMEWVKGLQIPPQNIFLVHGETESKDDLQALIEKETGFHCTAIHGVTEVDLNDAKGVSYEEATREFVSDEQIQSLQDKLAEIQEIMNEFLMNANIVIDKQITPEHLIEIKNAVMQLEKETLQLGMTVTQDGRK